MSAPIITRALVERFALAVGWERAESGSWKHGSRYLIGSQLLVDGLPTPSVLAMPLGINGDEMLARIGMCAAAEMLADDIRGQEDDVDAEDGIEPETDGAIEALKDARARLLGMAGVDPERWDAAREGGL